MKNIKGSLKTEIVFILDRSGSMCGLESDTIGGFNSMLKNQRKEEGDAFVTTVLFDDEVEVLHDRVEIKAMKNLTESDYYVRGTTALLDAIGKTVNMVKHNQFKHKADKVIFIITTDGMENASSEYTPKQIKKLVSKQQEEHNWEFIFLGANIDAVKTAEEFGIGEDRAVDFSCNKKGVQLNYEVLDAAISDFRSDKEIKSNWKCRIEEYYNCSEENEEDIIY